MATALFVKMEDIKRNSAISGSVDTDKFIQFVKIAQEVHILNYLGTDLYDKISADIIAGSLSGDYLNLTNDYIQPMLIHWALVEYLPFAAYTIANGGVYKHSSESSISVDKDEVDFLVEKERKVADHYTDRFIKYMCYNDTLFPEYNSNTNDDTNPSKDTQTGGWVL
jgi:hypothetical protein